jgi:Mn-dependent DtxR family transcriptional regulator
MSLKNAIPDSILDADIAILGKKGKGKSYCARGLVERLLDRGRRVIILDPLSTWWGLRFSRDGQAYDIPIIGGPHADIELNQESGEFLARAVVEESTSAIIDLGDLRKSALIGFATDFLAELFACNREPLWLVLEEADLYAPQQPMRDSIRLKHETEVIARRGRVRGFRLISITQRPARLHKDVLSMLSTLIALGVSSPQDRAAIQAWIEGNGDRDQARAVMDTLASLKVGEGWVWAPEADLLERVKFPMIKTLDTSATPKAGENPAEIAAKAAKHADILPDISRLKARLKSLTDEGENAAPEPDISADRNAAKNSAEKAAAAEIAQAEQRGYRRGFEEGQRQLQQDKMQEWHDTGYRHAITEMMRACEAMWNPAPGFKAEPITPLVIPAEIGPETIAEPDGRRVASIPPARQRILDALAWFASIGHGAPERTALAFMAEATASSSGFQNNLGALRTAGLIDYPASGLVALTEAGRELARHPAKPRTNEALHEHIFERLQPALRRILETVIEIYPDRISRADLAADIGASASSSGFQNNLGRLRSLGLIDYPASGFVVATKALFPIG